MYINKYAYSSIFIVKFISDVMMQKGLREDIMLHITSSIYKKEGTYLNLPVTHNILAVANNEHFSKCSLC